MARSKLFIPRKNWVNATMAQILGLTDIPAKIRPVVAAVLQAGLRDELANYLAIERWADQVGEGTGFFVFNFSGVFVTGFSDLFYPPTDVTYTKFACSVTGSGNTPTTVDVLKSGGVQGTLTIPGSSNLSNLLSTTVDLKGMSDSLQFHITGVGAGATGLVCVAAP